MAGNKFEGVVAAIVRSMEKAPFRQSKVLRAGYSGRNVTDPQRMIGHVECLRYLARFLFLELGLVLNWAVVSLLLDYHDLYKYARDKARVDIENPVGNPSGKWKMRVKRAARKGRTLKERREEYETAIALLEPIYGDQPKTWAEITWALEVFFLRKEYRKEAEFVISIGEAMDAHVFLWEVENGKVKTAWRGTELNIRKFVDELSLRLYHSAGKLYWKMVKGAHVDLLTRVYGTRETALAQ